MTNRREIFWTQERLEKAEALFKSGMSYREIGEAFGRSEGAVNDALFKFRHRPEVPNPYLKSYDGPPIAFTWEDRRFAQDAITGSARLLAEIERVFGRAA